MAREEGTLDDIRAILGNDKPIRAFREGKLPFPEATIITRLAGATKLLSRTTRSLVALRPMRRAIRRTGSNS